MKITPAAGPLPPSYGEPMADAKARATAKLTAAMEANSKPNPVPNPSNISPEELGAVTSEVKEPVQNHTSESSEAPAATKAPEEPLSSQYAQLARREKAIRAKAIEIKQLEAAAKASEAETRAQIEAEIRAKIEAEYRDNYVAKSRIVEDTLGVINEAGLSYDDLTNRVLNPPQQLDPTTRSMLQAMRDEIKALKGEQDKTKKSYEESQTNAYKSAIETIRRDVSQLVKTNPDFETVNATGSVNDVVDLIERTFKEGLGDEYPAGTVLDIDVAAKMVEDQLVEEALKIAKLKKIQQKLQPATQAATPKQQPTPAKTLTNAMATNRPLTAVERAKLAFEGKLQK